MSDVRDFYRISDLAKDFEAWRADQKNTPFNQQTQVQMWQATFMLAIAQQLSVISTSLGKIVRKAGEKTNDEN